MKDKIDDEFYKWFDSVDDMSKGKAWSKNTALYFSKLAWDAGIEFQKWNDRFDPICNGCGDPLTSDELICDNCNVV